MQHLLTLNCLLWRMPGADVMSGMVHGLLSEKKANLRVSCLSHLTIKISGFFLSF